MWSKHPGAKPEIDPRYFNVCVENTDFRPILFEDVLKLVKEQGGEVGFKYGNGPRVEKMPG